MRQIFLDTETTGLSPESGDRIIEIGCVEIVNRRLTGRDLHFYVNPERRNSDDALQGARPDRRVPRRQAAVRAHRRRADRVRARRRDHHPQRRASTSAFSTPSCAASAGRRSPTHDVRVTDSLSMARDTLPGQVELARRAVQALRGQQRRPRAARRAARRGPARRGLHPHDARPGLARHRRRRRAAPPSMAARPIDFSALDARSSSPPTTTSSPATPPCSPRSTRRAAAARSGALRRAARSPWHNERLPSAALRAPPRGRLAQR